MERAEIDRARRHLRLVDRRHGLRLTAHLVPRPIELRRVDRRQIDFGQGYLDLVVVEFGPQRIEEAADGELGAAIDRLQGHGAIGEGGADADDRAAIARTHVSSAPPSCRAPGRDRSPRCPAGTPPAVSLWTGAKTVAMATFTQTSIGPSSRSIRSAAASTALASATSVGIGRARTPKCRNSAAARSSRSGSRDNRATSQPFRANSVASRAADARAGPGNHHDLSHFVPFSPIPSERPGLRVS